MIICLSGLLLGGAPASWVFPSTAFLVTNVFELACLSCCIAPGGIKKRMQISAPVDVCVTVSVAGLRRDRIAAWFAVAKI